MAVQDRNNAVQGEYVRLFRTFVYNGTLYNMPIVPTVEIVKEDGTTLQASTAATRNMVGVYYVDYLVPVALPPGKYYDRWTWQFSGTQPSQQGTSYFQVFTLDQWLNFSGQTTSTGQSDRMAVLVNALENDFIYEAQHIPIYWEQGVRTPESDRINFAFRHWQRDPAPLVRKNGMLMPDGWMPDYEGQVFFTQPPGTTDEISVTYTFKYFGPDEIQGFIAEGLRAMNSLPPASSYYTSINVAPAFWDYGILLVAATHAMRRLVMGINFQERAIIFGEDPAITQRAQTSFQQLYSDYSTLWLEIGKGIKKALPGTSMVVSPEYTLPGGRARWFRYLYASPTS